MQLIARETGGIALLNTNDFDRGLSRVYQAVSTYYTVGVNLSSLPTGKYEEVRVEVNRPGVTVRARRGFEARPEMDMIRDRALATMETDLSYNAIPVQLQTKPATPGRRSIFTLPITVLVSAAALTFAPDGDKATAHAEFFIGSVDDKGGRSDVSRQQGSFQIPASEVKGNSLLRYEAQLQTKKGNYRIVVNVRDAVSGKMGTARANVRVE